MCNFQVLENSVKAENKEGDTCLLNSSLLRLENLITKIEISEGKSCDDSTNILKTTPDEQAAINEQKLDLDFSVDCESPFADDCLDRVKEQEEEIIKVLESDVFANGEGSNGLSMASPERPKPKVISNMPITEEELPEGVREARRLAAAERFLAMNSLDTCKSESEEEPRPEKRARLDSPSPTKEIESLIDFVEAATSCDEVENVSGDEELHLRLEDESSSYEMESNEGCSIVVEACEKSTVQEVSAEKQVDLKKTPEEETLRYTRRNDGAKVERAKEKRRKRELVLMNGHTYETRRSTREPEVRENVYARETRSSTSREIVEVSLTLNLFY